MKFLGSPEFLLYYTYPTPGKKTRKEGTRTAPAINRTSLSCLLQTSHDLDYPNPVSIICKQVAKEGELTRTIRTQVEALRLELEALAETVIADWTARAGFEGSVLETGICRDVSTYFRFWLGFFLYSQRTEFPEGLHVS